MEKIVDVQGRFLKVGYSFLRGTHIVDRNTGEFISVSMTDKILYLFMKQRWEYFLSIGNRYYDSQESLAKYLGVSRPTIRRSLDKLSSAGYILSHKEKVKGWESIVYDRIFDLELYIRKEEKASPHRNISMKDGEASGYPLLPPPW